MIIAGILSAGACATAITLYITRGQDTVTTVNEEPAPRVAPRTVGTVKFDTEPADANITIDGKLVHTGSPWVTELEAGVHQLQLETKGHKSWLTSIELTAHETQTLRVVLEPIGTAALVVDATLALRTTPAGLDAILDGKLLPTKTPIKMPLAVGPHSIVLQQDGVEVWRQDLVAKAAAVYEFSPAMDAEHQRERAKRAQPKKDARVQPAPTADDPAPAPIAPAPAVPAAAPGAATTPIEAPKTTPAEEPKTPPVPTPAEVAKPAPATPTVAQANPLPPTAPPAGKGPVTVPPSAVTKLSGTTPEIGKSKNIDLPSVVAAKVCIDATGRVTAADMITKIERRAAEDLAGAIRTWQYAPYKQSGVPTPACFAISFRVK